MKNFILFTVFSLQLFACQESSEQETQEIQSQEIPTNGKQTLEQYAERMIRAKLGIQANETFAMQIHRAQLDADGVEDAIVTVNRKDFAMKEAMASPNPAKRADHANMHD